MTTYRFARGFDDEPQILDEDGNIVAEMDDGRVVDGHRLLWRAATSVLAPDEATVKALSIAAFTRYGYEEHQWDELHPYDRDAYLARQREFLAALRDHATNQETP